MKKIVGHRNKSGNSYVRNSDEPIYKMCKMLCPICQNEWNEEIEMMGEGETAIVRCPGMRNNSRWINPKNLRRRKGGIKPAFIFCRLSFVGDLALDKGPLHLPR